MNDTQPETLPIVDISRAARRWYMNVVTKAAQSSTFRRWYPLSALAILLATTVLWAVLGSRLQLHNADQLSDPYLFANSTTFHEAMFPASHTFLLKWPIFWLVSAVGVSAASLMAATIGVTTITVLTLAVILYKIVRRPLLFGTICLCLALALLLIPAQPYAGGILPVNMAMLTTRNLEYAVYLVALVLLVRTRRLRSGNFIAAILLLAVLIASDKLFLSLSAGGALLALVVYALLKNWELAGFAARWLVSSLGAAVVAMAIIAVLSATKLTHFVGSGGSPYGLVSDTKHLVTGAAYTVLGIFTNLGANPVYSNLELAKLPTALKHSLESGSIFAYAAAFCVAVYALLHTWRLWWLTRVAPSRAARLATAPLLSLSLIWSSVAAIGIFLLTDHYYAVDARYLTITLFAVTVVVATRLRLQVWKKPENLLVVASGVMAAIIIACFTAVHTTNTQVAALNDITARNATVANTLEHHKVDVLVGDYWRVLPIKLATHGTLNALPLSACTTPSTALTSSAWQPDLTKHSFAYLVTLQGSLTNFPNCSLAAITTKYGRPNSVQVISGTLAQPKEALLFYDQGSHRRTTSLGSPPPVQITPISFKNLTDTNCDQETIMNIVAHQDDDLLFMNPDLLHELQGGDCVRTVYLTAGDAGADKLYWISRQLGVEAAYSEMLGIKNAWTQQTVTLADNEYVTIASPTEKSSVSLIFFNLPDGNMQGQGFTTSGHRSLARLYNGQLTDLETLDGQSAYTANQLISALSVLMKVYQPGAIHTQADVPSAQYPDHSDHITTGKFTTAAAAAYSQQQFGGALTIPVVRYIGYPIHGYPSNVSGDDLHAKEAAFFAYSSYDGGTCHTIQQCDAGPTYGFYLSRQYTDANSAY